VQKGQKGEPVYLRDEPALEEHLTHLALDGGRLVSGERVIAGEALIDVVRQARRYAPHFEAFANRIGDERLAEGILRASETAPANDLAALAALTVADLGSMAPRGLVWTVVHGTDDGAVTIVETDHGVITQHPLEVDLQTWPELVACQADATWLAEIFTADTHFEMDDVRIPLRAPSALLRLVDERGRKGLSIQRYKGLGEMNPDQLWETTLNPANRRLVRVRNADATASDEMFAVLMGDAVDVRKAYITEHGSSLKEIDIA
jgi:DNA gyrase subunit B